MEEVRPLKTEAEHEAAVDEIRRLMELNPEADTPEGDRLALLALLVEDYEANHYPVSPPDPIEAIEFRMEQQGLAPRDLIPYLGSRSRVSEVLSRKRPLTLAMIRALHTGLGIPASVLVQEQEATRLREDDIDWSSFPIREMVARGWISESASDALANAECVLRSFFEPVGIEATLSAFYRSSAHIRSARSMDEYALAAWSTRVTMRALEHRPAHDYVSGTVNLDFMREIARLSPSHTGPLLAVERLRKHGIALVVECHLSGAYLDGAAMIHDDLPVIGLTLRHDRIDNFWFCLMHELAHLALHLENTQVRFFDDLDFYDHDDVAETEADKLAIEALIPGDEWVNSPASRLRSPQAAEHLATKLGIHAAIVAGRIRRESDDYRILSHLVGHRQVRRLFTGVDLN